MRTLAPAMNSEVEARAVELAEECARTLRAYHRLDDEGETQSLVPYSEHCRLVDAAWSDHKHAVARFEYEFPSIVEWRDLLPKTVLDEHWYLGGGFTWISKRVHGERGAEQ